jgi:hypothetical protein
MKIYYLVYEQYNKIVAVFGTLHECFDWKPEKPLVPPILIKEVKHYDDGRFQFHDIQTSEANWSLKN